MLQSIIGLFARGDCHKFEGMKVCIISEPTISHLKKLVERETHVLPNVKDFGCLKDYTAYDKELQVLKNKEEQMKKDGKDEYDIKKHVR
ncbi:hypothetical protein Ciccas_004435 [Cichlidogyrus casuarinus]|uniref:Uncharacterized protein n=1 Tax=Cichlidogyrus casuarinus TaxID=1844966 RepID=A0ABD2QBL1_9PLAT